MTEPTIDQATFTELKDTAGADFVGELVDTFLAEAPALIADLRAAYDKRNAEVFRRTAHSLKSNGNTFGARSFAAMAKDLELGGFARAEAADAPLDKLAQEYSRVAAELSELRNA